MPQCPSQHPFIRFKSLGKRKGEREGGKEAPFFLNRRVPIRSYVFILQQISPHHWSHCPRYQGGEYRRNRNRYPKWLEKLTRNATHKRHRQEHSNNGRRASQHCQTHLLRRSEERRV